MEEIPVTGLEELEKHLGVVLDAPETPLDAKLFDEVELQLNGMFVYFTRFFKSRSYASARVRFILLGSL